MVLDWLSFPQSRDTISKMEAAGLAGRACLSLYMPLSVGDIIFVFVVPLPPRLQRTRAMLVSLLVSCVLSPSFAASRRCARLAR